MGRRRSLRGVTLVESLFAAFLTGVILIFTLTLYVTGMIAWFTGEGQIVSETGSHVAIRVVANELRQAMNVVIDANGNGITYTLPLQSGGSDVLPLATDGKTHRFELDGTSLNMLVNGTVTRTLCTGVILTDPVSASGTQPYQIFTASPGSIIRSVTVEVATQAGGYQSQTQSARNRETVFLRNVPELSY